MFLECHQTLLEGPFLLQYVTILIFYFLSLKRIVTYLEYHQALF